MSVKTEIIKGMCFVVPLRLLRSTPNVDFHLVPDMVEGLSSVDRVKHAAGAMSPKAPDSDVERPWYMHPNQEDNLLVFNGKRIVDLYTAEHGKVESFEITPDLIKHGDKVILDEAGIFGWPTFVFHRVHSPEGSMSLNFAKHFEGFDIKTNFNIYDLNEETGEYTVLRAGHLDQPKA